MVYKSLSYSTANSLIIRRPKDFSKGDETEINLIPTSPQNFQTTLQELTATEKKINEMPRLVTKNTTVFKK